VKDEARSGVVCSTDDESPGSRLGLVVPRDRIELSTPGFSATRTDVRRRPWRSTIVFVRTVKGRLASTVYHQCPRTKVSAKVSFRDGTVSPDGLLRTTVLSG
jgi:hypothetical protein